MQINTTSNNILTQLHSPKSLILSEMFVGRPCKIFIPSSVAYNVKNNALKAMIVLHWPLGLRVARHLWHNFCCKVPVAPDEIGSLALRTAHSVSLILITTFRYRTVYLKRRSNKFGAKQNELSIHVIVFILLIVTLMNLAVIFSSV